MSLWYLKIITLCPYICFTEHPNCFGIGVVNMLLNMLETNQSYHTVIIILSYFLLISSGKQGYCSHCVAMIFLVQITLSYCYCKKIIEHFMLIWSNLGKAQTRVVGVPLNLSFLILHSTRTLRSEADTTR